MKEEVLFIDPETKGKITQKGTTITTNYPENNDFAKCSIYKKQNYCCSDLCSTNCKYYQFHLKVEEFFKRRNSQRAFQQTLDYFFQKQGVKA